MKMNKWMKMVGWGFSLLCGIWFTFFIMVENPQYAQSMLDNLHTHRLAWFIWRLCLYVVTTMLVINIANVYKRRNLPELSFRYKRMAVVIVIFFVVIELFSYSTY